MSLQVMRESDVPVSPGDCLYRASRVRAAAGALVAAGVAAFLIIGQWPQRWVGLAFGSGILLFLFLFGRLITARFLPSNWLVRATDTGLFIHLRSYLNYHMAVEDLTVVFLAYSDIRSARMVREWISVPDPMQPNRSTTHTRRWIELELAIDPAPLSAAIDTEYARPAVWEKRWYGNSATLYQDYPVVMQRPPFVRIQWQVTPSPKAFLKMLASYVQVEPKVTVGTDFVKLNGLPREQQERRLRELDRRGRTIDAVYIARNLYSLDLSGATKFIDTLREGSQS